MPKLNSHLQFLLTGGTIVFLAAGAIILGTTLLSANPTQIPGGPPLPPRDRPELPQTSAAKPLDVAVPELSRDAAFDEAIKAGTSGNVDDLLGLAAKTNDWCTYGREVPQECSNRDDKVEAVFQDNGSIQPLPTATMRRLLEELYGGRPATLEFVARYAGKNQLFSDKYFLVFRMSQTNRIGGELLADAIGLTITPGADDPISWFTFGSPGGNGLTWTQVLGGTDGAKDFQLIAPTSLKGLRDAEGNIVE